MSHGKYGRISIPSYLGIVPYATVQGFRCRLRYRRVLRLSSAIKQMKSSTDSPLTSHFSLLVKPWSRHPDFAWQKIVTVAILISIIAIELASHVV